VVQSTVLGWWGLVWGVELGIAYAAEFWGLPLEFRVLVNLGLGWVMLIGGDLGWRSVSGGSGDASGGSGDASGMGARMGAGCVPLRGVGTVVHGVPLFYGAFGALLGHWNFTVWTGLYAIAGSLLFLGVGRRSLPLKPLTYLGLIGCSLGAYELLIYRLSQMPKSEFIGDAIVLFAALAMLILLFYQFLGRWLGQWLKLQMRELTVLTQFHWGVGTMLLLLSWLFYLSDLGSSLWAAIAIGLGCYALWLGKRQSGWIYPGLLQIWAAIAMLCTRNLPEIWLAEWAGAIAALMAFLTIALPWERLGWAAKPFRTAAAILPVSVIVITGGTVNVQSLLLMGAFYVWLARVVRQVRLSYLGLGLAGWGVFRLLHQWGLRDPLWYVAVISGAILFGVQTDPSLQAQHQRETRHSLRCLATGLFCLTALYQAEIGSQTLWGQGLLTIALSLGLAIAGVMLRTRAFLYVGTLTFVLKVLRQLWMFIADYSIALWALGIALGLVLIWIAATFEARRSQAIALVQYWITELEAWE
ncbi:MAG: hypothetical protein VKJ24_11330, partial [Synechococcales bacterium]|nr:hypothetical protein [Synechococcales bacterium]